MSFLMWMSLTYLLTNKLADDIKIIRNYISVTHATLVLLFFLLSISPVYICYVSIAYYTFDSITELYYVIATKRLYGLTMILHHIITCVILSYFKNDTLSYYLNYLYFLTELSNFPIYLVYHLKSKKINNPSFINFLIVIEASSFIILRLFCGGVNFYKILKTDDLPNYLIFAGVLIYLMSAFWVYGMFLQIIKNYNLNGTQRINLNYNYWNNLFI